MKIRLGVALSLLIGILSSSRAVSAQSPSPRDSIGRDSASADSLRHRPIHDPRMLLVLPAGAAIIVGMMFVAAPLAAFWGPPGPNDMAFLRDHAAVYAGAGGIFQRGQTWANSANVELIRRSFHVELLTQEYWRPQHIRYFSSRGSYLWHPRRGAAGAVTVGYVYADGISSQSGPEIGLPLFLGDSTGSVGRFEPAYVITPRGLSFSYRLSMHWILGRSRYFLGGAVIGHGNPPPPNSPAGDFTASAFMLVLGKRF